MLNAGLRRVATAASHTSWALLFAFSLLRPWWFVSAGAAVLIYWVAFTPPSGSPQNPQIGPGQYQSPSLPPTPGPPSASGPSATNTPVVVPLPQGRSPSASSTIRAVAAPELQGIQPPPPPPPPLPEPPFGVVRGYKPPPPPPSNWPF